jgi:sulfoxide reductase heme-binding subunit YedZ
MLNQQRWLNHLSLFLGSASSCTFFYWLVPGNDRMYLTSMATAYTGIVLLTLTLAMGPFKIWKGIPNPVSTHLRRDIGIWCGIVSLLHVVAGIQVHMGNIWLYFVKAVEGPNQFQLRDDIFGFANFTGLAATLILAVLLVLSNDLSLRTLGTTRWKNIQRFVYFGFVLIFVHGFTFQVIETRNLPWVVVCLMIMILALAIQITGVFLFRSKR